MFDDLSKLPPGKSLAEAHKERLAKQPDPWTYSWLKSQLEDFKACYRGVCHALNLAVARMLEYETKQEARFVDLERRVTELEADKQSLMAKVGEQQADITIAMKRIDDMAEWAKKQKSAGKQEKTT